MTAVAVRARALLRQNVRATIVLALIAGLAGGLVLAAWSAARRGKTSFDRFRAAVGEPELAVSFCAPDVTTAEAESDQGCRPYDPVAEAASIRSLDGVGAAWRAAVVFGTYELGGERVEGQLGTLIAGDGVESYSGSPLLIKGRLAAPDATNEVVVPEEAARLYHVDVGDVVGFAPTQPGGAPSVSVPLRIVGQVRTTADLAAGLAPGAAVLSDSIPHAGPGFWRRYGRRAATWGAVVFVSAERGDPHGLEATVRGAFPGRFVDIETVRDVARERTVEDAIRYETVSLTLAAIAAAAAWLVFVGQALFRQSAREHEDARTYIDLGFTRRQLVAAAAARAAPAAAGAAVIALVVCGAGSLASPVGRAAEAEVDRGLYLDWFVLVVGAAAIFIATVGGLVASAIARIDARRPRTAARRLSSLENRLPIVVALGLRLTSWARRGAHAARAAVTTGIAVAVGVAGLGLVASLHHLTTHSREFGASWDAMVVGSSDVDVSDRFPDALAAVRAVPAVRAAAGIAFNTDARIGGRGVSVASVWTVEGPDEPWVRVIAGRAPRTENELALGSKTRRALGLDLGDTVSMRWFSDRAARTMTVVGEALLYDGAALEPGEAAVVDARWFGPQNERVADAIVVRLSSRTPNWRPLSDAGLTAVPPPAPPGVRNLQQIDGMPTVIVVLVALLAFAALTHALTTMSHIQNRQLAVLRALGLRPYQRLEVLACAALSVVLVGLAIGVPLGLALERWLWSTLAEHIGFASPWFGGWRALAIVVIAALASGLAISAVQARHRPSAASLRAE